MEKEFNVNIKCKKCIDWRKEIIDRETALIIEFMNKVLNANTKSKNFIEINDFTYHLNNLLRERKKISGDKLTGANE